MLSQNCSLGLQPSLQRIRHLLCCCRTTQGKWHIHWGVVTSPCYILYFSMLRLSAILLAILKPILCSFSTCTSPTGMEGMTHITHT